VICVAEDVGAPDRVEEDTLVLVDLADGTVRDVAADLDLWPANPRWLPSGDALVFEADQAGHRPLFRVDLATDEVTRLTAAGAYTDVCVAPDGTALYALHATIGTPPRPVRLRPDAPDQDPTVLPSPVGDDPAGRVERVVATADDGVEIGSWLVLPADVDGPAPLVVFIHGGPLGSWNTWHWRWNPYVLAAQGYAVLLPDPALSTGYGRTFIERGWGRWGEAPATDVLAAVEAAAASRRHRCRPGRRDGWVVRRLPRQLAGGTSDRFRGIVTHASLWALEGFHGTTDVGLLWEREFGDPYEDAGRFLANSPRQHVGDIRTPMLVIHGEKDYRVPISEALILWTDLMRHGVDARFLYFPDENHWVLKPQNARLWYRTVLAFLDEHLRDVPFERPELV
jgi:dipeptidyl aminopeptidase/acylaminoacyl peptidase